MQMKSYLEEKEVSIYALAKKAGLCRNVIYRVLDGMPIDFKSAKKIVTATEGLVSFDDLIPQD